MAFTEEMKRITENIKASCDVRINAVGGLIQETNDMLKGIASDRTQMAHEQAKSLADFTDGLSKGVGFLLATFRNDRRSMSGKQAQKLNTYFKGLAGAVDRMLGDFKKTHTDMSDDQAKSLTNFVKSLTRDVGLMINDFRKNRMNMSDGLDRQLEKETRALKTYVSKRLKEFGKAHAQMSKALKKDLHDYVNSIANDVSGLLRGYNDDRKGARKAWGNMTSTLDKKRSGGHRPAFETKKNVSAVKESFKERAVVPEKPKPAKTAEVVEMDLPEAVLDLIDRHNEGIRVGEMEESLGITRIRIGQAAKNLLEENRVRKEGSLYFPL